MTDSRNTCDDPALSKYGGLCPQCTHVQVVRSAKDSVFLMCDNARVDQRFPKYPPQPVGSCFGFEAKSEEGTP